MSGYRLLFAITALTLIPSIQCLNNGFTLPAMGYSTWNDCSSFRDNGPNGWCYDSEAHVRNVTSYFISSGLKSLGYSRINIDEGWFLYRDNTTGAMVEDFSKFPSGMTGLGTWIKGQGFHYGLYSCRGTCQCGTGTYHATGSHGFEAEDVAWMIQAGADYLKIDSCCGDQTHSVAFSDYGKFRDAMNATIGKNPVWFSVCGWNEWYSPPDPSVGYGGGGSLGNSWRIAGDGQDWKALSNCINQQADAAVYAGPGAWPDPDLLVGPQVYVGGQSDTQARAQFTLWSIFPTNLLISQNVLQWSPYALETYSNAELIAINQDALMSPARRIQGSDLSFPCSNVNSVAEVVATATCDETDPSQQWTWDTNAKTLSSNAFPNAVLTVSDCKPGDDGGVVSLWGKDTVLPCGSGNAASTWVWSEKVGSSGTITSLSSGNCLDIYNWAGPTVDTWTCNKGSNQNFTLSSKGLLRTNTNADQPPKPSMCLKAQTNTGGDCSNIWGRVLSDGAYALAFVNNAAQNLTVTCDAACFTALNISASVTRFKVRDLWAHQDVSVINAPFSFSSIVDGTGGSVNAYKLTPM